MPIFEGESKIRNPVFTDESTATCKDSCPVDINAPDLVYSDEDDKVIDAYNRKFGECSILRPPKS